jgi:uncharacterized protein YigA (DUF484 family)
MDANQVASYLKSHPEFFEQYAELLSRIHIPSPHGGKAISITERQIGNLRERVKQLETKMAELIRFGEENDAIGGKMHRLSVALQGAADLAAALRILYEHLGEDFAVPHVAIRLWAIGAADLPEFAAVDPGIQAFAAGSQYPYCGPARGQHAVAWLGEQSEHVRSVAQVPLHQSGHSDRACVGLLLLASEEAQRFYPEMGTLFLQQIGDVAAATISRLTR